MTFLLVCCVAVGGFVGAPARFLVDRFVADRVESDFPVGTLAVNLSGAFAFGLLTGLGLRLHLPVAVEALLGTGLCGAFTTFSSWSFETVRLLEDGQLLNASLNALVSLLVGLLAAGAGLALGLVA
ncbi:MAG TPA: fluoride efflux transporter CrcB [Acidimicrobiales bacterium]|nr:fluoride efflux transporter CrcB [Acidimicrobiales bacterium]